MDPSGPGVPICGILSNRQTVTVIQNFLQAIRDVEKKSFGFNNQIQLLNVRVGFSMALI